jgi:hypothetical protein
MHVLLLVTESPDFTIVADACAGATVAAGASCAVTIRFTPARLSAEAAILTAIADAPGSPFVISLQGRGAHGSAECTRGFIPKPLDITTSFGRLRQAASICCVACADFASLARCGGESGRGLFRSLERLRPHYRDGVSYRGCPVPASEALVRIAEDVDHHVGGSKAIEDCDATVGSEFRDHEVGDGLP